MEENEVIIEKSDAGLFRDAVLSEKPSTMAELKAYLQNVLKTIAGSAVLSGVLQKKSAGYVFPDRFEESKIEAGDKLSLMIPPGEVIPYTVNLIYSVVTNRVSLKDLLDNYFFNPFGEAKECELFVETVVVALAEELEKETASPAPAGAQPSSANNAEKIKELVTILSQIRGMIATSGAIMQDKKSDLISVSSGMVDYAEAGDARMYKMLSIGFKNTLNTAHQSLELKERLAALSAIEYELGFGS